jgi:AbrB family looped-hinge helix DNA binding protein
MDRVTVSPKYHVVIPRAIRDALGIRPGQVIQVIPYENRIVFIPMRHHRELRGSMRGMRTDLVREED